MTETPRQESGESRQNTQDAHNEQLHEAPEGIVSETNSEANDPRENEAIEKELQAFLDGEALTEDDLEKRIEALLPDEAEGDASEHAAAETKESAPAAFTSLCTVLEEGGEMMLALFALTAILQAHLLHSDRGEKYRIDG